MEELALQGLGSTSRRQFAGPLVGLPASTVAAPVVREGEARQLLGQCYADVAQKVQPFLQERRHVCLKPCRSGWWPGSTRVDCQHRHAKLLDGVSINSAMRCAASRSCCVGKGQPRQFQIAKSAIALSSRIGQRGRTDAAGQEHATAMTVLQQQSEECVSRLHSRGDTPLFVHPPHWLSQNIASTPSRTNRQRSILQGGEKKTADQFVDQRLTVSASVRQAFPVVAASL